jgi:hypothetical protein
MPGDIDNCKIELVRVAAAFAAANAEFKGRCSRGEHLYNWPNMVAW